MQRVFRGTILVPTAMWIRLNFNLAQLSGEIGRPDASYMLIISEFDGAVQQLYAEHIPQWSNRSAYFNGDTVHIEIYAAHGTGPSHVRINSLTWGEPGFLDRSICGPQDDRVPSADPRIARVLPAQCSAWLVENQPNSLLSAGHCAIGAGNVIQFNVPASTIGGSMRHPSPEDQYPVDPSSVQVQNGYIGVGNDWRFFGTFENSNTGLSPMQAQLGSFRISPTIPPIDGRNVRVTGYGQMSMPAPLVYNYIQTTHSGALTGSQNNTIHHLADTTGGNSGAPLIDEVTGLAIGVHTHGGCNGMGSNRATATRNVGLRAALAAPIGKAATKDGIRFEFPGSRPAVVNPLGGTPITVRVSNSLTRNLVPEIANLHVLNGSIWIQIPMVVGANSTAVVTFPPLTNCAGPVRYYFSALNSLGETDTWPRNAPANSFVAIAANSSSVYASNDFQTASGWTFWGEASLTSGRFKVAKPNANDLHAPSKDFDGSSRCLLTGSDANEDVDHGATRATSPSINLALAQNPYMSFAAWFSSSLPDHRSMFVQVSSNAGATWTTIDTIKQTDGWEMKVYRILDHVPLTTGFRVRLETGDGPEASIVEAAIDRFRVEELSCIPCTLPSTNGPEPREAQIARLLSLWNAGDLLADLNADNQIDIFDILILLNQSLSNCP